MDIPGIKMYSIKETKYGLLVEFYETIDANEMFECMKKVESKIENNNYESNICFDMRNMKPLSIESREIFDNSRFKLFRTKVRRTAYILNSSLKTALYRRMTKEAGTFSREKYFSSQEGENWENEFNNWLY